MRALVLGAGASKSYDASPTGQRMPIARDFFDIFDRLDLSANPWVLIGSIIGYVEDWMKAGSAFGYLRSGIDIEDLHSRIEADRDRVLSEQGLLEAMIPFKAYNELVFLFTAVINSIQNGPTSRPHVRLAKSLAPDDVVITFNWDTLLDRALAEATPWRPDAGYGVQPKCVFADGWREPNGGTGPANTLLKLHGSTNWLTAYSTTDGHGQIVSGQDADPGSFGIFERASGPYACFKGRYMGDHQPYSYGYYPPNLPFPGRPAGEGRVIVRMTPRFPWMPDGDAPDDGLPSMPLIIPPVRNKTYDFFGSLFRTLWSQAEDALASADEIIIVGYSFPRTDVQSERLFRTAFSRRQSMPAVSILDPNPDPVAQRMRDFGIDEAHLRVTAGYFTEETELFGG